jgi:predicted 2-oxoglutarate/Fe(II)-dependent dioxygenase YbiX
VIEDFLSPDHCRQLVDIADKSAATWLKVVNPERSTAQEPVYMTDPRRVTERVDMSAHQDKLNRLVKLVVDQFIEPEYQDKAAWFEQPHMLKYTPGGYYHMHADSQHMDPKSGDWDKVLDRDVSLLIYLNEGYSGGALRFDNFNYTLQPKPGMLVYFPSDHRYMHTALPVTSGTRYAMVSWVALKAPQKVCAKAPASAIQTP